jgi:signal transduction histidine kinase
LGTVRTSIYAINDAIKRDKPELIERASGLAERNILRCVGIIEELLDFTRFKEINAEETGIDDWLTEIIHGRRIPQDLTCVFEPGCKLEIPIDRERLRRAVENVINNAIQALQDKESSGNTFTVATRVDKGWLAISVADTGPGIPDECVGKIFEPLYSTRGFGVGLGLPIVEDIVGLHGGWVEVVTETGCGTTVVLWIPVPDSDSGAHPWGDA